MQTLARPTLAAWVPLSILLSACSAPPTASPPRASASTTPGRARPVTPDAQAPATTPDAPSAPAVSLAVDDDGACVALADGGLTCWGAEHGVTPHRVPGVTDAVEVSRGGDLVVRHADGAVRVFPRADTTKPAVPFPAAGEVTSLSLAYGAVCYATRAGTVSCHRDGLFDDAGKVTKRYDVPGLDGAVRVFASFEHGCAIKGDGMVACWEIGGKDEARLVPGLVRVVDLQMNSYAGCARANDGVVSCFRFRPQVQEATVIGRADALSLNGSPGDSPMVCLADGKDVACTRPEELRGSWSLPAMDPGTVALPRPVRQLASTKAATCALDVEGHVACWGLNINALLGRDDPRVVTRPTLVPGVPPLTAIALGDRFTCGVTRDENVTCWGAIGSIAMIERAPVFPRPRVIEGVSAVVRLVANNDYACAFSRAEEATCFFARDSDPRPKPARVPVLDGAREIALPALGFANAVGAIDRAGQLLVGPSPGFDTLADLKLTKVSGVAPAEHLAIVSLGLRQGPESYGWVLSRGPNGKVVSVEVGSFGQKPPRTLRGVDGAAALNDSAMALLPGGRVVAARLGTTAVTLAEKTPLVTLAPGGEVCGTDAAGSFGCMAGDRFEPMFTGAKQVASSGAHVCALDDAGALRCRGSNSGGECGVLVGVYRSDEPLPVRFE